MRAVQPELSPRIANFPVGQLIQTLDRRKGVVTGHTEQGWAGLEVRFDGTDYDTVLADSVPLMKRWTREVAA